MTSRFDDVLTDLTKSPESLPPLPPLPAIDWSAIGHEAPSFVDLGKPAGDAALPKADVVVITWTSAEWSALDHVFVNSDKERQTTSDSFGENWHLRAGPKSSDGYDELWGYYCMVKIKSAGGTEFDVLLYKSSAHLAHPPYCEGLMEMVRLIIAEAKPAYLYTIGTAGGASLSENLGDTVVTNAGHIMISLDENKSCDIDGRDVDGRDWFPSFDLVPAVEEKLLFKLDQVVSEEELERMLWRTIHDPKKGNPSWEGTVTVADLVNEPLNPANLGAPKGLNKKDIPLLTTDFYYIAHGNDSIQYSALEMDDAVIGLVAGECDTKYVFVRNISDPLVPDKTKEGKPIVDELREGWSSQIYSNYGIYTSMNGALITWATIAGDPTPPKE